MRMQWICWVVLAVVLHTAAAWADGRPQLQVQIDVAREVVQVDADGQERLQRQPVDEVETGDVLVYTLHYRNTGNAPARGAVLSDPVPAGTVLVRSSVAGDNAEITFSTDGKSYSAWPQEKRRKADGKVESVDVPPAAVRHIRWRLAQAVPPGGTGEASFKVIVQ